jgi:hypothetical protein
VDHLGFQTDDAEELAALKARAQAADIALLDEGTTTCCYAESEKHWVTDPQGVAWEHFHTLASIPTFNQKAAQPSNASACCTPSRGKPVGIPVNGAPSSSCC